MFTPGDVDDRKPLEYENFVKDIYGRLVGGKGYISKKLLDRLFVTDRYLSSLVSQVSQVSAKEWIDRALIAKAKVALRHSDITSTQLSDELNFPNTAFFCKYFKRIVGCTPTEYRQAEFTR